MNLGDATAQAVQILDEERVEPTVHYEKSPTALPTAVLSPYEPGLYPASVREIPGEFQLQSTNFNLLSTLLDQVREGDRAALLASLRSRMSHVRPWRNKTREVVQSGSWRYCTSELPLVGEFLVRHGDKQFIPALGEATPTPGLTLLLIWLEQMIAFNFTLFTDEEYTTIPAAIAGIKRAIKDLGKRPRPLTTEDSNAAYHVVREVPGFCDRVVEACRKARFFYVKGSLVPEMNLEVNEDKNRVRSFLEKLGFTQLLIDSLNEAESLYRATATPFELKSSMGHLRSFLEQLHLQACAAANKKFGESLPSTWGAALK
jgi:hypothetical protein